jgi:hypothetical protein
MCDRSKLEVPCVESCSHLVIECIRDGRFTVECVELDNTPDASADKVQGGSASAPTGVTSTKCPWMDRHLTECEPFLCAAVGTRLCPDGVKRGGS